MAYAAYDMPIWGELCRAERKHMPFFGTVTYREIFIRFYLSTKSCVRNSDKKAYRTVKGTGLEKNSQHYLLSKVMRTNVTKVTKLWHFVTVWKFKVLRIRYEHYWSEFNHGWPQFDRHWPPVISSNGSENLEHFPKVEKLSFSTKIAVLNQVLDKTTTFICDCGFDMIFNR